MKVVDKRTHQMLGVMNDRREKDGKLDMTEMIKHWAYDLMAELTFGQSNRIVRIQSHEPFVILSYL
jgi:hypothetical protein